MSENTQHHGNLIFIQSFFFRLFYFILFYFILFFVFDGYFQWITLFFVIHSVLLSLTFDHKYGAFIYIYICVCVCVCVCVMTATNK